MYRNSKLSLVLAALATLIVTATVMFTTSPAQAVRAHNNKVIKTTISIRTATQIGNRILSPGKYMVKITPASDASGDPTIQVSVPSSTYTDEISYEEVLLTVQASVKKLDSPAQRTELVLTSGDGNKASGLLIRGDNTEYVFVLSDWQSK